MITLSVNRQHAGAAEEEAAVPPRLAEAGGAEGRERKAKPAPVVFLK
jgi:hypothetical protein